MQLPDRHNTLAVVVTFRPDAEVVENVRSAASQVERVLVVDNTPAAESVCDALACIERMDRVELVRNGQNIGLASALNYGLREACCRRYEWVLLLDQDTFLLDDYLERMRDGAEQAGSSVGVIGANFRNARTGQTMWEERAGIDEQPAVITSGSLLRTRCVRETGLFIDGYFIDYIDVEYCLRLRRSGFRVVLHRRVLMVHGMGNAGGNEVLGYKRVTSNYAPERHYYIMRNFVATARAYSRREPEWLAAELIQKVKFVALSLAMEPGRSEKLRYMVRGVLDGLRGNMGRCPYAA